MRALFDVNMLLAMFDAEHVFSGTVRRWWSENSAAGWASSPITQNGFVRVITQKSYPSPITLADALVLFRDGANRPGHEFWPDELSLMDGGVFDYRHMLRPSQITDSYLLALAVRRGGRLITLDQKISPNAVRGKARDHLVVIT